MEEAAAGAFEEEPVARRRVAMPMLPKSKRLRGVAEVELGFTRRMAETEAERCLRCDLECALD